MAALMQGLEDPLKKVMPRIGPPVQNLGGMQPNTAPIANRPVASPGVNTGTPGPAAIRVGEPAPGSVAAAPVPIGGMPGGVPIGAPTPGLQATQGSLQGAIASAAPAAAGPSPQAAGGGGGGGSSAELYGRGGGASATGGTLEDQLRNYITGGLGGVTSKAFIDRAKNQLGSAVEGQRQQAVRRSDSNLIGRGLYKSGIGAEQAQAIDTGAQGALSSGISDILSKAEQQDIAGRESAAGTAGNLLGMNRSWDQYSQQRADEQAARAAANAPKDTTFQYQDPDTGQVYTLDNQWFQ